jgi:short-subunit dehydrogenase
VKGLFSHAGKTALITGGSVGIGAMIAEGFVNFGARVYLVARSEEALRQKRDELAQSAPASTSLPM